VLKQNITGATFQFFEKLR